MKRHAALLSLAIFVAFSAVRTSASTPAPALPGMPSPDSAPQAQFFKVNPAARSATGSANPGRLFTVNDEKGLVLTCIAPEIDTNLDTDAFQSCTLAPGRTLDDVMHTFIQGIHYELSAHEKEREEWQKALDEMIAQKPAQR